MSEPISIRFHDQLDYFLPAEQREQAFDVEFKKARSVKDLIESIGIPHTEIDLILNNGRSVDFAYQVQPGDKIDAYPASGSFDFSQLDEPAITHCQPEPLSEARFVLDVHLGRLAAYLRMLGFDTLYRNDYDDLALAVISAEQCRILLTCDRMLLMRKQVIYGYYVRNRKPQQQLEEILSRYHLYDEIKPFSRCMHCNGETRAVRKRDIATQLLPKTKKYYDEFYQCDSCNKIYWQGSHYLRMQDMINKVTEDAHKSLHDND